LAAFLSGFLLSLASERSRSSDCRFHLNEGENLQLRGLLVGPLVEGRGEFLPIASPDTRCRRPLRLIVRDGAMAPGFRAELAEAGRRLRIHGTWRKGPPSPAGDPLRAGYILVDSLAPDSLRDWSPGSVGSRVSLGLVRLGGWVQRRLATLFPRSSSLAVALVWARKDGLSPETREAFARAGTAHLLAISGFHVGVVAGVLLVVLSSTGLSHPLRYSLASTGVWAYVAAIGFPNAAVRAAVLLSILSLGRIRNRRVASLGALASAFLGFLLVDPGALINVGFQLSFAGALGLVAGYRPLSSWFSIRSGGKIPLVLCGGLGAGAAATLATMPLVAWHFGRVSLIGIPVTLLLTPLVAAVIPGIFLSLVFSTIHLGGGSFLASGVEVLLGLMWALVDWASALPLASIWVSRPVLASCMVALGLGCVLILAGRGAWPAAVRGWRPRQILLVAAAVGIVTAPLSDAILLKGSMEIVVLDVGQGDATLLRSPGGRWVLVDAGPRTRTFDAGEQRVLPYLRKRGIGSLDLVILTHPDMDHVGGAARVLQEVPVTSVLDPGLPAGSDVFLDALRAADATDRPWITVRAGDSLSLGGMAIRVLAPEDSLPGVDEEGNNAASVVLEIRFGAFAAILAGDAPALSEGVFLPRIRSERVQLLKVGHHGSSTSTTPALLRRIHPMVALISAGRRNRFGHPHPEVLSLLAEHDVQVFRTDRHGTLTVRARPDGSYTVSAQFQ
jgi:competence protein ComEC